MTRISLLASLACSVALAGEGRDGALRVATFNLWDLRAEDLSPEPSARAQRLALVVQSLRPDIVHLTEIAFDEPAWASGRDTLARAFAALVASEIVAGVEPLRFQTYDAPVNTGVHSGHDLNNDGTITPTPGDRAYAEDCFGYGEFPGQYGMALLVRDGAGEIDREGARTFRRFLWKDMPGALLPPMEVSAEEERGAWYSDEELRTLRLSSKSHWDIPVRLAGGGVLHVLASHPTPPVFDGPEDRNGRRNHDEIRFWVDYLSDDGRASYIVDDAGVRGGLAPGAHFIVLGDLNADPEKGDGRRDAIRSLLSHERARDASPRNDGPRATIAHRPEGSALRREVSPTDTAFFGLRADHAIPSRTLTVHAAGVVRDEHPDAASLAAKDVSSRAQAPWWLGLFPSDHFPVFVDVTLPTHPKETDR